jgi:hypothetical protein
MEYWYEQSWCQAELILKKNVLGFKNGEMNR